jgi:hypothetical protein
VAGVYCAFAIVKSVSLLHGTLADERGQRLSEESDLNTKETIQGYFSSLKQKKGWESFLSNDMIFTSFTSPIRRIRGRATYLEGTKRFYSMITAMEVKDLSKLFSFVCVDTVEVWGSSPHGPTIVFNHLAKTIRKLHL